MVRKFIIVFLQKTNTPREAARPPFFCCLHLSVELMYNKLCFEDGSVLVKARSYTRVRTEVDKRKPATTPKHKPVRVIDKRPDEVALPGLATKPGLCRVFFGPGSEKAYDWVRKSTQGRTQ